MSADTIFALSSGAPPAAISVIRISGPRAHAAGETLAGTLPDRRYAAVRELRDSTGALLDEALVLRFDGPASSTGEDLVEFHCHGGRAVVNAVLGALASFEGLRLALPGEFTRRAFESGRIDLTEAEGLADLIEAETESQRRAALLMAEGGLSKTIADWQQRVLDLSARAEAAIDYVEDGGTDADIGLSRECEALAKELEYWLERRRAEPLREGVLVVIAGPPNAGKSSLLNAIAGFERAIVSDIPGTTRDHVDVPLSLDGVAIRLTDTAGLREIGDSVEQIGVERARRLVNRADIVLWLGEPDQAPPHARLFRVHAKCDLPARKWAPRGSIGLSSITGEGLKELIEALGRAAREVLPAAGQIALNQRQAICIADAHDALSEGVKTGDPVLLAEALRLARRAFDRLTGRAGVEDMLDSLFGRFCLGK